MVDSLVKSTQDTSIELLDCRVKNSSLGREAHSDEFKRTQSLQSLARGNVDAQELRACCLVEV